MDIATGSLGDGHSDGVAEQYEQADAADAHACRLHAQSESARWDEAGAAGANKSAVLFFQTCE